MAMRLSEVHPALVHFPLTLLPVSIGADLLGRLTGSETLQEIGRATMPFAVAAAAVAGAAGLVAQQEVKAEGEALDALITHRNINLTMVGIGALLAAWRVKQEQPSAAYLALGLAGLGALTYSAYLGGHMVYELGVGVKAADGLRPEGSPELTVANAREVGRRVVADVEEAIPLTLEEVRDGKIAPALGIGERASQETTV